MLPLLLLLPATLLAQTPAGPPFAPGAALLMPGSACHWQTDISAHHPIGPGLAGGVDSPAQASATACEKWCCDTSHMKSVKSTPPNAAWKFTEEAGGDVARQCDLWAWKEDPGADTWLKGCWVAAADYVPGEVNPPCPGCGKGFGADPSWLGAHKCLDPGGSAWGVSFLLFLGIGGAMYVGGGAAYGSKTCGWRSGGRLGPLGV